MAIKLFRRREISGDSYSEALKDGHDKHYGLEEDSCIGQAVTIHVSMGLMVNNTLGESHGCIF